MSCAEVIPTQRITLCGLMALHRIKLRVIEVKFDGKWCWQTETIPRVMTHDPGCWGGGGGWITCHGQGETVVAALESFALRLSGAHIRIAPKTLFSLSRYVDLTSTRVESSESTQGDHGG